MPRTSGAALDGGEILCVCEEVVVVLTARPGMKSRYYFSGQPKIILCGVFVCVCARACVCAGRTV